MYYLLLNVSKEFYSSFVFISLLTLLIANSIYSSVLLIFQSNIRHLCGERKEEVRKDTRKGGSIKDTNYTRMSKFGFLSLTLRPRIIGKALFSLSPFFFFFFFFYVCVLLAIFDLELNIFMMEEEKKRKKACGEPATGRERERCNAETSLNCNWSYAYWSETTAKSEEREEEEQVTVTRNKGKDKQETSCQCIEAKWIIQQQKVFKGQREKKKEPRRRRRKLLWIISLFHLKYIFAGKVENRTGVNS